MPVSTKDILVDDDIFNELLGKKLGIAGRGYVYILPEKVKLHRYIMGVTNPKIQVDHINGNKLDNRRSNLRLVSNKENGRNLHKHKRITNHGYFGVSLDKREKLKKRWMAYIKVDYKFIYLGRYATSKEAALAYNKGAEKYGFLTRNIVNE